MTKYYISKYFLCAQLMDFPYKEAIFIDQDEFLEYLQITFSFSQMTSYVIRETYMCEIILISSIALLIQGKLKSLQYTV